MMQRIRVPNGTKIAVVGDIHEHEQQFDDLLKKIRPSKNLFLISLGDVYDKGFGESVAESITSKIKGIVSEGYGGIIQGNHELKLIKNRRNNLSDSLKWLSQQPISILFEFENGTKLTVIHAGVTPKHTAEDLGSNIDICYIRTLDENGEYIKRIYKEIDGKKVLVPAKEGKTWHQSYDGRFGYIISGHDAQKDGIPKFYNYSCNIDTAVYDTGILTGLIFGQNGREDLISISGPARKPEL